jgi:hypothetical protein
MGEIKSIISKFPQSFFAQPVFANVLAIFFLVQRFENLCEGLANFMKGLHEIPVKLRKFGSFEGL